MGVERGPRRFAGPQAEWNRGHASVWACFLHFGDYLAFLKGGNGMADGYFARRGRDIQAILSRDPAARGAFEVVTCYPGYKAVRSHRRAHWLWKHGWKWAARRVAYLSARRTGIEIHPGARIGEGLFIDHGNGVVIGETAVIGDDVTLYQGVTLGGTGKDTGKRHPTLGDGVVVGAGAKVLGPFTVGDRSKIGAGAIVLKEVPADCTVVGNPGRIVRRGAIRVVGPDLDQVHLPDPIKETIDAMVGRIGALEKCINRLRDGESCDECPDQDTSECYKKEGALRHADL